MKTKQIVVLAGLVLAACGGGGLLWLRTSGGAPRSYTLGVIGNFKGKNSQVGVESFNAIMLAYDEYQQAHPGGFDLQILPVDDSWDATKTRSTYLSCADQADLLILLTGSSLVMLIADDIRERPDTVHALLGPTTTLLSGKRDNIVRNVPDLEKEQSMVAAFVRAQGWQRVLIVLDGGFNAKYTEPAAEAFQRYAGLPQVDVVRFSGHQMDTDGARERLRQNRYDALYAVVGGMPREAAILIQQARAIQPDIPVLITPWIRGMLFEQALGSETSGIFMPSHLKLVNNPRYDHFSAAYRKMFGAESQEYFVPLMYDLAHSLFAALDRAKSPKTGDLLPVLLGGEYAGTMGSFRYDAFGESDSSLHFYEMKDGQWRYLAEEYGATP